MAVSNTPGTAKTTGGPDTATAGQQLNQVLDHLEAIDFREVKGMSTAEAAALCHRLDRARELEEGVDDE